MRTKTTEQVEIRIPRSAEFVRVARMAACAVAAHLDFTYDLVKDVELAVGEACANAVEHVADETCDEILVRFIVADDNLTMEVIDKGEGFDPEHAGNADSSEPGGLGLIVIRALMNEVHITCDPTTGTCVRMVKYRTGR